MRRQGEHSRSILFALHFVVGLENANTAMFLPTREKDCITEKIRGAAPQGLLSCTYSQTRVCKLSLEINQYMMTWAPAFVSHRFIFV